MKVDHMKESPHGIRSDAYSPVFMGRNGAVVTNHWLASQAGTQTLQRGGNAVDAAVAIGFALTVVEPQSSGIGGDGFVMVYMRDTAVIEVANGTGAAPLAASVAEYRDGIPEKGVRSISVPGIVDALLSAHERFGQISLLECLEPSIMMAEQGVPISHRQAIDVSRDPLICSFPTSKAIWAPQDRPPSAGEIVRNPDLAATMRRIAQEGREGFYMGGIASEIVRFTQEHGGLLTEEDFARHRVQWQEPIKTTYRERIVYEAPPNSTGNVLLQELNILECFEESLLRPVTTDAIHIMAEAKRLCFADREAYLADPRFVDIPIEGLLSKGYAADRARLIDPDRRTDDPNAGDAWAYEPIGRSPRDGLVSAKAARQYRHPEVVGDTTYFAVVDRWGNAVSELQSIQMGWGSGVVAGRTGILMNNRMTTWHLEPDHPNVLKPGKRVRHTMNPVMVFSAPPAEGGRLELVCGTPGGDTQVQTNMQVLSAVLDHGFTVSEATAMTRWTHLQNPMISSIPHTTHDALQIESRAPKELIDGLQGKGHNVERLGPWGGPGSIGMIQAHSESGAYMAAADPRRDGLASAW